MTVIAPNNIHIYLIKHRSYNICLDTGRIAQRVLHGIDFGGAPLNHENIGIYEAKVARTSTLATSGARSTIT